MVMGLDGEVSLEDLSIPMTQESLQGNLWVVTGVAG
jgi:hypothetical protein